MECKLGEPGHTKSLPTVPPPPFTNNETQAPQAAHHSHAYLPGSSTATPASPAQRQSCGTAPALSAAECPGRTQTFTHKCGHVQYKYGVQGCQQRQGYSLSFLPNSPCPLPHLSTSLLSACKPRPSGGSRIMSSSSSSLGVMVPLPSSYWDLRRGQVWKRVRMCERWRVPSSYGGTGVGVCLPRDGINAGRALVCPPPPLPPLPCLPLSSPSPTPPASLLSPAPTTA